MKMTRSPNKDANDVVHGARQEAYNHPFHNFNATAHMLNGALYYKLAKPLTGEDVPRIVACLKLARESFKHKYDNVVDICGYMETLQLYREHNDYGKQLSLPLFFSREDN